jgi:hypothetical protein
VTISQVFWNDLDNEPDVAPRLLRSVSEDDGDVQALVDSIESAVTGASASSKLNASSSKRKQLHSLGSLLDGFNERVADLEQSAKARMNSFSEIRYVWRGCDAECFFWRAAVFARGIRALNPNKIFVYVLQLLAAENRLFFFSPILIHFAGL